MTIEIKVSGFNEVEGELLRLRRESAAGDNAELSVGYDAPYALRVHEDLVTPRRTGQAKYLETALRSSQQEVAVLIRNMRGAGIPLRKALEAAGHLIIQKTEPLVPVDTGFLRDSNFVEVE